ncbi:MAG: MFS transporter [Candidatus Coatesbacteria bacterium]
MEELLLTVEQVAWNLPRRFLTEHAWHLRRAWNRLGSNARALAGYNIFWTIPNAFAGIYLLVYMKEQGLTEIEIGSIVSAQLTVQVVCAVFAGWVAERFGRLRVVTWVDGLCWPLAFFFFTFARGYLMFAIGFMLVGGVFLLIPAWNSLFLQGSPKRERMSMFAILQIPWFIGAILASASGFLVREIGVTRSCRWIFGCAVLLTSFAVWYRGKHLTNPDPPARPVRLSFREFERFLLGHWIALQAVVRGRRLMIALLMQVLFQAGLIIGGTYTNLYLVDARGVGLPKPVLAMLPLVGGTTVLLTTFLAVPHLAAGNLFRFLFTGIGCMGVNVLLLLLAPLFGLPAVLLAVLFGSVGFAVFNPAVNAHWTEHMNDAERARLDGFRWVVTMLVNIPIPVFAGALYKEVHPRMPLFLILTCYGLILACALWAISERKRSAR